MNNFKVLKNIVEESYELDRLRNPEAYKYYWDCKNCGCEFYEILSTKTVLSEVRCPKCNTIRLPKEN